jgi:REP element-mobilizing transposase RayT
LEIADGRHPFRDSNMNLPERRHLQRLETLWFKAPIYFLTLCAAGRRPILCQPASADILAQALHDAPRVHGWLIGRFVIMPDHLHFFCTAASDAKVLSAFVRDWKRWTARQIERAAGIAPPIWQTEFFDHVLRSPQSYAEKWDYVRQNPVRAGLAANPEEWSYQGEGESLRF